MIHPNNDNQASHQPQDTTLGVGMTRRRSLFAFGAVHPTRQQYNCHSTNLESLVRLLPQDFNPFGNWMKEKESGIITTPSPDHVSTWFPHDDDHVVLYSDNREPLTYAELFQQLQSCPPFSTEISTTTTMVVALVLPPCFMAEMAVTLLSLFKCKGVCVAPLDPNLPPHKLLEALEQLGCTGLVSTQELLDRLQWDKSHQQQNNHILQSLQDVRIVSPSATGKAGAVEWTILHQDVKGNTSKAADPRPTIIHHDEPTSSIAHSPKLLLRTSGTTSTPKVVPLTGTALLYNATCLAASLKLQRDDVGCNAMPLFHIGGIACALLSVLVSGSSVIMMQGPFDPNAFLDCVTTTTTTTITTDQQQQGETPSPTWYYAAPTLHKALILTGKARILSSQSEHIPNRLRFIRSGAAHLPHETAVELSRLFHTQVIPTYSMSECMPICSSQDGVVWNKPTAVVDTVGPAIGCSVCIVDEEGRTLKCNDNHGDDNDDEHHDVGEVALKGPGVMEAYIGIPRDEKHTDDGWLKTGDIGYMDRQGRLFLKGRLKEMIKRGGEQVWPNEVDHVVEQVPGVATAVTFGVPNDLWGEEVAVAVVLDENTCCDHATMKERIQMTCKQQLDAAAVPCQVVFVQSREDLLKGSTGKYLRNRMARHLGVTSVDTGALHALECAGVATVSPLVPPKHIAPSPALNGVRFVTACFVVQHHIGLFPNSAWVKIQSFSVNMQIFFMLGAFQLACSVKSEVLSTWSQFVGTKIGAMHALFVVSQLIALPSYFLFECGPDGYQETFENSSCSEGGFLPYALITFVWVTATGLSIVFPNVVNGPAWFQSVFYIFLLLFPCLDNRFRKHTTKKMAIIFAINLAIATFAFLFLFDIPGLYPILNFSILSWLPALVAAMIAGYFFMRFSHGAAQQEEQARISVFRRPGVWGIVTDILSLIFLLFEVIAALSPDCIWVEEENFVEMRPGEKIPEDSMTLDEKEYVYVCDVSYDEFLEYVHADANIATNGRWITLVAEIVGFARLGTPLVLLWLYGMAFGRGITARIMNNKILQILAPMAYPLYLLHLPIGRYYWLATRGLKAENWWQDAAVFPIPVEWYEVLIVIAICLVLGALIDTFILRHLMGHTVKFGMAVCRRLSSCCGNRGAPALDSPSSTMEQVGAMVKALTGNEVDRSTSLRDLGLDSLGATALLGTLRASVPEAKKLTLQKLAGFETVGDLVDYLDETPSHDDIV